uniref:Argonaute-like protein n=1 Tax=Cryphonectria parasitica TaxID=5116 RepID=D0U264_CRYPA|nr:argonaute-like protein [Cryphonectria parasitica]
MGQVWATDYKETLVLQQPLDFKDTEALPLLTVCRETATVQVHFPPSQVYKEDRRYDVRFQLDEEMDLGALFKDLSNGNPPPEGFVKALSVIFGYAPLRDAKTRVLGAGRYFKDSREERQDLVCMSNPDIPKLMTILRGFVQNVRPATGKFLLNVNVTYGIFRPKINLGRLLWPRAALIWGSDEKQRLGDLEKLHGIIQRTKILYKPPKKKGKPTDAQPNRSSVCTDQSHPGGPDDFVNRITIAGFARRKDSGQGKQTDFPNWEQARCKDGDDDITVKQYFEKYYKIALKHPELPLINRGTPEAPDYIPAERCWLDFGQARLAKIEQDDAAEMIRFACQRPFDNATKICNVGHAVLHLGSSNQTLQHFGLSVGNDLLKVQGRELDAPLLAYRQSNVPGVGGLWNLKDVSFCSPQARSWVLITLQPQPATTLPAIQDFKMEMLRLGMKMGNALMTFNIKEGGEKHIITGFHSFLKESKARGATLALIVFPYQQPSGVYNKIKFLGDVVHGLHTVCVIGRKFVKNGQTQREYFANVSLKINLKLGGTNHQLTHPPELFRGTMVVGYDAVHPTAVEKEDLPSHMALVASVDEGLGQWSGCYWTQKRRQEIADATNLKQHMKSRLELWMKERRRRPERIIIYRDGVSDSQYEAVMKDELPQIEAAYRDQFQGEEPKITLVVAVKRHSTRFYPSDPTHMTKSGNMRSGTIVDRGITEARYWEFFLTAHEAIQGTARPARYVVLRDDIFRTKYKKDGLVKGHDFTEAVNKLEEFTHKVCYLFGRATRAVSLCTPAYYADILCTRARAYESAIAHEPFKDMLGIRTRTVGAAEDEELRRIREMKVHDDLKNSMFWI